MTIEGRAFTEDFSLMIKSYRRDFQMTARLLKSIETFNVDAIPVFLVCPAADAELFASLSPNGNLRVIAEESIQTLLFSETDPQTFGSGVGYMNQQVFKLAFSTLGHSKNYLCLDSDGTFLRPFTKLDFINERTNLPYLFQSEDRELRVEDSYVASWEPRREAFQRIESVLGAPAGDPFIAVHGFQVFSSLEIASMMSWLASNSEIGSFKDMLSVSGYEFNWYTTWVRTHSTQFVAREPIFKTFHGSREFARSLFF